MIENFQNPNIKPLGRNAILISWAEDISEELLYFILNFKNEIEKKIVKSKVEVINTYNSLLISYVYSIENIYSEISTLKSLLKEIKVQNNVETTLYTIPVCYDEKFGLDLAEICTRNKLKKETLIALHSQSIYTVYFIGFLPGFLYLGGLEKKLVIPRKETPRLSVKKGAVGIGGNQTGIYPQNSAGGWQIIGNCPLNLFDVSQQNPSPFQAGDKIKFKTISVEEHQSITAQIKEGSYTLKKEVYVC